MRRSRITLAATALVLAGAGGIAYAATSGGSGGTGYGSSAAPAAVAAPRANAGGQPTVRVATVTVQGKTERILVDAHGMPLYTYRNDTATTSRLRSTGCALAATGRIEADGARNNCADQLTYHQQRTTGDLPRSLPVHVRRRSTRTGHRPGRAGLLRFTPDSGRSATTGTSQPSAASGYAY